ncbi:MAG: thioredoxin [Candidatus Kerfeldbacteria bacterium RIFOXYA2_FULL_38_24]|uniref:Thioredoxin n=1 Tax=Candidatus Kerfeldbacteria bacterium RIFOXYB2_FULL_38_14 TaxID=1798547 RepID=A0A1G2BDV1_9BACT|nr:MAG: thioredoxin [Candidatus Kerfeldbacteria bacterium RIFOXYA2_FULL_38_24]OGY87398.1 MAG: thioredoxin [Candidatus Kerfeldbacteria bacterium RIFOXYB2_FULL_38_14]OGY90348.1 MAG: thioredoxin [Candidatus Kerfeldbacteria bacterium RIFOXYC2_FULL_38_9]
MAQEINDQQFETEVLKSTVPVLVDFWAPWCGPCKMLGPVIEELSQDNTGKNVKIVKINIDENNEMAGKYNVMSIPTIMFFKNGQPVDQMTGVQEKSVLQAKLDELA